MAATLAGATVLAVIVLSGDDQAAYDPSFCGTPAAEDCSVPAPPCEAANSRDRNAPDAAVSPGEASRLRAPGEPLPYGFNDGAPLVGQLSPREDIGLHEAAGSSVIRFVIDWGEIEATPNRFDFSTTDEIYCAAAAGDVRVLLTVAGVPTWAVPQGVCDGVPCVQPPEPSYLPALQRFAEIAAIRYPRAVAFEAWNEPNLPAFWPSPDPSRYAALLEAIYEGVKDGSPHTPVLGGAVANSNTDGVPPGSLSLSTFLSQMLAAGAGEHMDGVSIHAYPIGAIGSANDDFTPQIAEARRILEGSDETFDLPLWITETGVTTEAGAFSPQVSPQEQAAELKAIYEAADADARIQLVAFHTLLDPNAQIVGGPGFGWFAESDGVAVPKPVACAFRQMTGLSGCPSIPLD